MAAFVQNMAVTLLVGVLRIDKWFDIYDHRCELRAGMEEIVRVTIKNSTSQRAAYNISINEGGNTRRDQVKVGMIGLKADGSFDGDIKPIDSGWVDVPVGQSVDVSIGAMEAMVLEFCFTWATPVAGGLAVTEPRFIRGQFGGGVYHLKTSEESGTTIPGPKW